NEYARRFNLLAEPPLGFNDSFAIVIRGPDARSHQLLTISQAVRYASSWRPGFGYEFMERPDGYDGFVKTYGLKFAASPRIMDLGLLYRALESRQVDIIAGNTTDGQLLAGNFAVLADDRHYFPPYQAVVIVRSALAGRHPNALKAIAELSGQISDHDMQQMNYEAVGKEGHHCRRARIPKIKAPSINIRRRFENRYFASCIARTCHSSDATYWRSASSSACSLRTSISIR